MGFDELVGDVAGFDFVGDGEVGVEVGESAESVEGVVPEVLAEEKEGSVALELEDVGDFVSEEADGDAFVGIKEFGADENFGSEGDAAGALS